MSRLNTNLIAAEVFAKTAEAFAEIESMKCENEERVVRGMSRVYGERDFLKIAERMKIVGNKCARYYYG